MWKQFVLVLIVTTANCFCSRISKRSFISGKSIFASAVAGPLSVVFYIVAGTYPRPQGAIPLALTACFLLALAATRFGLQRDFYTKKIYLCRFLAWSLYCYLAHPQQVKVFIEVLVTPNNFCT